MPRLNNPIATWCGERIIRLSRAILAFCYGLRQTAGRIRQNDLDEDREFIIDRLLDSMQSDRPTDIKYWTDQLSRIDAELAMSATHTEHLTTKTSAELNTPSRRASERAL